MTDEMVMYLYIDLVSAQNYGDVLAHAGRCSHTHGGMFSHTWGDVLAHAFKVMMPVWHVCVCNS